MNLESLSDEELIDRARRQPAEADACLAALYRRDFSKVAAWCLRISGDRQEAGDLVSGGRKLKRRFGRWLARQSAGGAS